MSDSSSVSECRLAVLIDADNVSHTHIAGMFEEIARYGNPTIKRIYGDWTKPNLAGWKTLLLDYAISPVQQFSYTTGKNATDSAMIIDAMDILYQESADGFCIVSSDSDFTRLAMRLREAGRQFTESVSRKHRTLLSRHVIDLFISKFLKRIRTNRMTITTATQTTMPIMHPARQIIRTEFCGMQR